MMQEVAGCCRRMQEVAGRYRRMQEVAGGYKSLQEVAGGCRRMQEGTGGWRRMQEVARGCRRIQEDAEGCGRVQEDVVCDPSNLSQPHLAVVPLKAESRAAGAVPCPAEQGCIACWGEQAGTPQQHSDSSPVRTAVQRQ